MIAADLRFALATNALRGHDRVNTTFLARQFHRDIVVFAETVDGPTAIRPPLHLFRRSRSFAVDGELRIAEVRDVASDPFSEPRDAPHDLLGGVPAARPVLTQPTRDDLRQGVAVAVDAEHVVEDREDESASSSIGVVRPARLALVVEGRDVGLPQKLLVTAIPREPQGSLEQILLFGFAPGELHLSVELVDELLDPRFVPLSGARDDVVHVGLGVGEARSTGRRASLHGGLEVRHGRVEPVLGHVVTRSFGVDQQVRRVRRSPVDGLRAAGPVRETAVRCLHRQDTVDPRFHHLVDPPHLLDPLGVDLSDQPSDVQQRARRRRRLLDAAVRVTNQILQVRERLTVGDRSHPDGGRLAGGHPTLQQLRDVVRALFQLDDVLNAFVRAVWAEGDDPFVDGGVARRLGPDDELRRPRLAHAANGEDGSPRLLVGDRQRLGPRSSESDHVAVRRRLHAGSGLFDDLHRDLHVRR